MNAFPLSLKTRVILSLVLIVTLTSTLFAVGVLVIKQQLEEVIFGNMVRDQLHELGTHHTQGSYQDHHLFENWDFYSGPQIAGLDPAIRDLSPGSHHSVVVADQHYQVEVAEWDQEPVFLTYNITKWEDQEHKLLRLLGYGVGLVFLAAMLMGLAAANSILAPVRSLTRCLTTIEPGQRNLRISRDFKGNEIGEIAGAFDKYLERLDKFVEREQSFTAAASHELRTPLSVVMGAADILATEPPQTTTRRAVERIQRACAEMHAFIEATLFLSREGGGSIEQGEQTELKTLLEELVAENNNELENNNIDARIDAERLIVKQPTSIVKITIGNILRNAIEHTRDGHIRIALRSNTLSIEDDGLGIPPQDLPHIFERSYSTKREGTGMGLNLVRRVCDRFHWSIEVSSELGKGTKIVISFPAG